jgi:diguanylate cyclase (GGDEF)-like protein
MIRARRAKQPLTIAYLDLDNFKKVNDTAGHHEGDRVLIATASALAQNIRATDFVARMGGDEFAILFPDTSPEVARTVINKLDNRLKLLARESHWPVGFSIGMTTFLTPPPSIDHMIKKADTLMYKVKTQTKQKIHQDFFVEIES